MKGGNTGFAGIHFFKGRVCLYTSGSCGQESRGQSPQETEDKLKMGAPYNGMEEPDRGPYHAVLNPTLRKLLSKEPCDLTSRQVLSPVQGQALALRTHQPLRENPVSGMSCEFGQRCCGVCVSVFSKTHRLNEPGQN